MIPHTVRHPVVDCRAAPLICALLLVSWSSTARTSAARLHIELTGATVSARSVTPGGTVVVVGASRELLQPHPHAEAPGHESVSIEHVNVISASGSDDDDDGRLQIRLERPISRGVIGAVDLSSGQYSVLTVEVERDELRTQVGIDSSRGTLSLELKRAFVTWIRPGVGVWSGLAQDGAPRDLDRHRLGKLRWPLKRLTPWTPTGRPLGELDRLDPADLLVVVDLETTAVGFYGLSIHRDVEPENP